MVRPCLMIKENYCCNVVNKATVVTKTWQPWIPEQWYRAETTA